jgi:membrane-associated phospholipid phosphatase
MNAFDARILSFFNQFVGRSPLFDKAVVFISGSDLLKGQLLMAVLWWLWFQPGESRTRNRQIILSTVAASLAAILTGRLLAHGLPFRVRPLLAAGLGLRIPSGVIAGDLRTWSSFPSDHALLFTAFATGLLFISRRLGAVAFLYVLFLIELPRVYLALHYPTDILGGALLGTTIGYVANQERVRSRIASVPLAWLSNSPSSFYACFFLLTVQIGLMFWEVRRLLLSISRAVFANR